MRTQNRRKSRLWFATHTPSMSLTTTLVEELNNTNSNSNFSDDSSTTFITTSGLIATHVSKVQRRLCLKHFRPPLHPTFARRHSLISIGNGTFKSLSVRKLTRLNGGDGISRSSSSICVSNMIKLHRVLRGCFLRRNKWWFFPFAQKTPRTPQGT